MTTEQRPSAAGHAAPHRLRRHAGRPRSLGRLPDVPQRPRLAHRAHQERAPRRHRARSSGRACASTRSTPTRSGSSRSVTPAPTPSYWEAFFAAEYGLPTALFHGLGRNLAMGEEQLERLFDMLDTGPRAKALMEDYDLHIEFPHVRPGGGGRRQTLNLSMFGGERRTAGVDHHRVQWCSNRPEIAERLDRGRVARASEQAQERAVRDDAQGLRRGRRARPTSGRCRRADHQPAGADRRSGLELHAAVAPPGGDDGPRR